MCGSATPFTVLSRTLAYVACSIRLVASQRSTRSTCDDQVSSSSSRSSGIIVVLLTDADPPQHAGVGVREHPRLLDAHDAEVQDVQAAAVGGELAVDRPLDAGQSLRGRGTGSDVADEVLRGAGSDVDRDDLEAVLQVVPVGRVQRCERPPLAG